MLGEENKYTWCEHYEHVVRRKGRYGAKFVNTGAEKGKTSPYIIRYRRKIRFNYNMKWRMKASPM